MNKHPLIVSLTPFATDPPHMGGQVVIRAGNAALARRGWQVEQFSLGVRREDLAYIGRARVLDIAPGYREHRATHPALLAAFLRSAMAHRPFADAGTWLDRVGWPDLEAALGRAAAVIVEHPWPFAPHALARRAGPLVLLAHNVESWLASDEDRDRVTRIESRALAGADHVGAITAEDREALTVGYALDPARVSVVARGIALPERPALDAATRRSRRLELGVQDGELLAVFSGSLHGPNREAALQVQALAGWCGAPWRFLVAGSVTQTLGETVPAALIVRSGDPRPWLECADLALNPMLGGSGINIKMLEYMAAGLPTLTTPFGARGLPKAPDAYRVAQLDEWSEQLDALTDPVLRANLGATGRSLAREQFSADASAARLDKLIESLCGRATSSSAVVADDTFARMAEAHPAP